MKMEDQKIDVQKNQDRFTSFMFGSRSEQYQKDDHHHGPSTNPSSLDYEELMINIDTLMESIRGFKPLLEKVYPYIENILKKK